MDKKLPAPKLSTFSKREIALLGGAGFGLEIPCTVYDER